MFRSSVRSAFGGGVAAAALLLLSACDEPASAPAAPAAEPGAAQAPAASTEAEATAGEAPGPLITIDSEGLRLVDPSSGSTRPLPFDTPESDVLAVVSRRGDPESSDVNAECGAGPTKIVQWPDGLSLLFQDDAFVGWSLDGRSAPKLTTMSGVGAGSTRAELEGAYAATFEETSLGTEFQAGGMGGVVDGPGPDAKISTLWAGTTCIFR